MQRLRQLMAELSKPFATQEKARQLAGSCTAQPLTAAAGPAEVAG
jgi:hypothetical protein